MSFRLLSRHLFHSFLVASYSFELFLVLRVLVLLVLLVLVLLRVLVLLLLRVLVLLLLRVLVLLVLVLLVLVLVLLVLVVCRPSSSLLSLLFVFLFISCSFPPLSQFFLAPSLFFFPHFLNSVFTFPCLSFPRYISLSITFYFYFWKTIRRQSINYHGNPFCGTDITL